MKAINIIVEDAEFKELNKSKGATPWRQFILELNECKRVLDKMNKEGDK